MKKVLLSVIAVVACITAAAQGEPGKPVIMKGSKLDLETFNKLTTSRKFDDLSLIDLRLLRNGFAAKQGYCFRDFLQRAAYEQTSWYLDKAMQVNVFDTVAPVFKYTQQEEKYIAKIKAREKELRKQNYITGADGKKTANKNNILNLFEFDEMPEQLLERVCADGFAIVPAGHDQMFHLYEQNDYHNIPSFVTTDMYLQLFHLYFTKIVRHVETKFLVPALKSFCTKMYDKSMEQKGDDAKWNAAFYAVALRLLGDNKHKAPSKYRSEAEEEVKNILQATDGTSPLLGEFPFHYSLFKPRGTYTRSEEAKQYFRAMMWIQHAYACLDNEKQFERFVMQADIFNENPDIQKDYEKITKIVNLLIGEPDDISITDIAKMRKETPNLADLSYRASSMAECKTRISPKQKTTCAYKARVMPQRYNFDSEVLQELVDYDTYPTAKRAFPSALDIMAAYGCKDAEKILLEELKQQQQWDKYEQKLNKIKSEMKVLTYDKTVYNMWTTALVELMRPHPLYPDFMQSGKWQKKNLNAALASYSELKHDAILYSKHPMGAECGGAGLDDPVVVGYVEPNVAFYQEAEYTLGILYNRLKDASMLDNELEEVSRQVSQQLVFLLSISRKELKGEQLTDEEYSSIEYIGSTYEWLSMQLLDVEGPGWELTVQGPDKKIALITDVYTGNARNNPNKGILEIGTGLADDVYVLVEINGYLYLTRGAVFSYREFTTEGVNTRMNDEEWQKHLETHPRYGVPEWMNEIIFQGTAPKDNEKIFYSGGC